MSFFSDLNLGYWSAVWACAGVIYGLSSLLANLVTKDKEENIALWLLGAYQSTWSSEPVTDSV